MPGIKRKYGQHNPFRPNRQGRSGPINSGKKRAGLQQRTGGFLGLENKYFDITHAGTVISPSDGAGGELDPNTDLSLNVVNQGDGETNRDGRQICITEVGIQGVLSSALVTASTELEVIPELFVALVHDSQTNGAQLNSEDVFHNGASDGLLGVAPTRNLKFIKRFKVLATKTIKFPTPFYLWNGTTIKRNASTRTFDMGYKWKKCLKVNYSGTTSDITDIVDNSLHIIAYASSADVPITLTYHSRLRFTG